MKLLLVLVVLLPTLALASQVCSTANLNIRPHPDTRHGVIYTSNPGDSFEKLDSDNYPWYHVRATSGSQCGTEGYASSDYLVSCGGSSCGGGWSPTPPPPPSTITSDSRWLSSVSDGTNTYRVEKLDRSTRRSKVSHYQGVNKFLLHTIEGAWPSNGDWESGTSTLDRNTYWPHFIVAKDRSGTVRVGQYLPLDAGAYALKSGNHDGCIQVEVGGKADRPFTSNDSGLTSAVRALFKTLQQVTDIPNSVDSRVRFTSNGAWGENAPQRLSSSTFKAVAGIVGHQHVPGNDHWDPGAINPNVLL